MEWKTIAQFEHRHPDIIPVKSILWWSLLRVNLASLYSSHFSIPLIYVVSTAATWHRGHVHANENMDFCPLCTIPSRARRIQYISIKTLYDERDKSALCCSPYQVAWVRVLGMSEDHSSLKGCRRLSESKRESTFGQGWSARQLLASVKFQDNQVQGKAAASEVG